MDEARETQIRDELNDAIATVLRRHGEMPTTWVAAVETVDSDGQMGVWRLVPPDAPFWRLLGMTAYLDAAVRNAVDSVGSGEVS